MFISLAVLLVPIAAFFLFWQFLTSDDPVTEIDPSDSFAEAAGLGLDVETPQGLSQDWKALSSAVSQPDGFVTLRVGYYTPEGAGIQLVESQAAAETVMVEELREAPKPLGTVAVDGRQWQSYVTVDGNYALVYTDDELVLIVHGDADSTELESFAGSLN